MTSLLPALAPLLLILAGLGVRFVVRFAYGPRGPAVGDWRHASLMVVGWSLIGLGLVPLVLTIGATVIGLLFVLMGAVTLVELVAGGRAAQRRVNAALLAELAESPGGLETGAALAAALPPGRPGNGMRELFDMISRGAPLRDALSVSHGAAPGEATAAVAVGQAVGDVPAALRALLRSANSTLTTVYRNVVDRVIYLSIVILIALSVLTFVLIWIVPEFEKIFDEFAVRLPPLTGALVGGANLFSSLGGFLGLLLVGVLGLAFPVVLICYLCDAPVLRPLTDRIGWSLRVAEAHRYLGLAALRGGGFAAVLEQIAEWHPSGVLRRRAGRAAESIVAGGEWTDALVDARLLSRAEQSLVRAGAAAGNLPWVFETIADRRARRLGYRASAAVQVLFPVVVFVVGAAVGLVVTALFLPLTELIHALV